MERRERGGEDNARNLLSPLLLAPVRSDEWILAGAKGSYFFVLPNEATLSI